MDARSIFKINLTISIALILSVGLTAGYAIGYFRATRNHFPEIRFVNEINPGTTTIKLMEVKNGKLYGQISGQDGRVAYSPNDILTIKEGGEFEIPLNAIDLKTYYQANNLPQDVQFIASKQGKYYYSVLDKRAFNISNKNRLYFSLAEEAEEKGYRKK